MATANATPTLEVSAFGRVVEPAKLAQIERLSTDTIQSSLLPGQRDSLKVRKDETILDGHHRVFALRARGVDVNALPREIVSKV